MSAKPFHIPNQQVMQAYRLVKANAGAAGVDQQSLADFEGDLKNNLYRLWNRLSSGSYFPPAVEGVLIPKKTAGEFRLLGVPTLVGHAPTIGAVQDTSKSSNFRGCKSIA